ncbi:hypothetical protein [Microbacterium sp. cx-59]|uniref:hypothetical protein n=1 Tax=Microbacterium sp. cx-59 TaxID=2891207 RepID=UPI001E578D45|nr:hypothetical protein [Microbacterium sp. cx-59]MCC4909083.1 hypothetical protein [Microbacterium sp. cx-59]
MKNKLKTRLGRFVSACVVVAGVSSGMLFVGSAANAAEITSDDSAAFEEFYDRYGVDDATQQRLIQVLESGELLDSMTSGAEPVSTVETDAEGSTEIISTFEDGSISVTSLEKPSVAPSDGTVAPRAVSGCTLYNGGGFASYSNCLVSNGNGTTSLQFRADYSRSANSASISNWRDAQVVAHYGTASAPTLTPVRTTATPQQPAVVTMYSRFTSYNGLSSEDLYLSLRVSPSQAWTTTY